MPPSIGAVLKRAREVRALSAVDTARSAGISAAYLSKLENDTVKSIQTAGTSQPKITVRGLCQ